MRRNLLKTFSGSSRNNTFAEKGLLPSTHQPTNNIPKHFPFPLWREGIVPTIWRRAEGCFVPREWGFTQISQFFEPFACLVWRERSSFLCLSKEWVLTWPRMDIFHNSIQKRGIERFSGCLEHTGVLSQLIQEAKEKKGNFLTVVWLDLANAYRSIPHNLVQVALDHYHIPHHIQGMITSYLGDINSCRLCLQQSGSQWRRG